MSRPREFDEPEAVDHALAVFWRRGYAGASITELSEATGLGRQSLYNAFADKHGLFRAALARYAGHVAASLAPLEHADAGLAQLRAYLEAALAELGADDRGGCLIVKTALGPEVAHPDVRRAVEAGAGAVRRCFARVLARARARGELPRTASPDEGAAALYALLHGLTALARTGGDPAHTAAILTRAFDQLARPAAPGLTRPPRRRTPRAPRRTTSPARPRHR